jgi:molecular chaperone HtpG
MAEIHSIQSNLDGIFEVLSQHLYSSPEVFIRELVQNAQDAIVRRRLESPKRLPGKIVIRTDPARHIFSIEDNGAGMSREELKQYLTTIGDGYARSMRTQPNTQDVIGRFGLGFLTAYTVASDIRVHSRSAGDSGSVLRAQDFHTFVVEDLPRDTIGTEITLQIKPEFTAFAQHAVVSSILTYYFQFLKTEITLDGQKINKTIKFHDPSAETAVILRNRRLDQVQLKNDLGIDALLTMDFQHLDCRAKLWILSSLAWGKTDHRSVQLYIRGVRVKHPPKDLIPAWAGFCGALIFSSEMELTASREHTKASELVETIKRAIHSYIVDQLIRIAQQEKPLFRQIEKRYLSYLIDGMAVDGRLFEALIPVIQLPTNQGPLPLEAIFKDQQTVYMSTGKHWLSEAILFMTMDRPIVNVQDYSYALLVQEYARQRKLQAIMVDGPQSLKGLFKDAAPCQGLALLQKQYNVMEARFEPGEIPFVLIPNTRHFLKKEFESNDAESKYSQGILALAREFTQSFDEEQVRHELYVNLNNILIQKMLDPTHPPRDLSLGVFQAFVDLFCSQYLATDQKAFLGVFKNLQELILKAEV